MARDLQASAPSPLCANVLGGQGPPGEMMKRRRLLIPSPLDWQMPPRLCVTQPFQCLRNRVVLGFGRNARWLW